MKKLELSLPYWCLAVGFGLVFLAGLERLFRADFIWRRPLGVVLQATTDLNSEAVWASFQPPSAADRQVLLLGASTAQASMDLPNQGTARLFAEVFHQSRVEYRSLCPAGATFAEYLALVENALDHGSDPDLLIIYTWPGMLTAEATARAQAHAEFLPLVSRRWLGALEAQEYGGFRQHVQYWLLTHSALVRHRYYVNGWLRRRFARLIRRDFALEVTYSETRYRTAREEPLENDSRRFERVSTLPQRYRDGAAFQSGLVTLLAFLQEKNLRAVLVEAPRSPPARRILQPLDARYTRLIGGFAKRYGVAYVDLNPRVNLTSDDFADLIHVSWQGRERWLAALLPVLAELMS
jgi:hypothetical protein